MFVRKVALELSERRWVLQWRFSVSFLSWNLLPYHNNAVFRATESGSRSRFRVHNAHLAFPFPSAYLTLRYCSRFDPTMLIAWPVHICVLGGMGLGFCPGS